MCDGLHACTTRRVCRAVPCRVVWCGAMRCCVLCCALPRRAVPCCAEGTVTKRPWPGALILDPTQRVATSGQGLASPKIPSPAPNQRNTWSSGTARQSNHHIRGSERGGNSTSCSARAIAVEGARGAGDPKATPGAAQRMAPRGLSVVTWDLLWGVGGAAASVPECTSPTAPHPPGRGVRNRGQSRSRTEGRRGTAQYNRCRAPCVLCAVLLWVEVQSRESGPVGRWSGGGVGAWLSKIYVVGAKSPPLY